MSLATASEPAVGDPANRWFRGPSQIQTPKGISFGLSVLAQLVVVTDRQWRSLASIEATAAAAAAAAAQS